MTQGWATTGQIKGHKPPNPNWPSKPLNQQTEDRTLYTTHLNTLDMLNEPSRSIKQVAKPHGTQNRAKRFHCFGLEHKQINQPPAEIFYEISGILAARRILNYRSRKHFVFWTKTTCP